jgi:peroxiredoxin
VKRPEVWAAIAAIVIGAPLVYVFARAIAEGQVRTREAPMRAILGDEAYEELASGEPSDVHYLGNDRRAPDFTLRDENGEPWQLSDHRGKVVILNFWSITCRPCVEEMPTLIELGDMIESRDDVELVTITVDESWDQVSRLFPRDKNLEVLFDPDKEVVAGKFGTRLYPETWFIDPDGLIRLRVDGPRDWSSPVVLDLIESLK